LWLVILYCDSCTKWHIVHGAWRRVGSRYGTVRGVAPAAE
jgi:hypothetical protein